MIPKRYDVLSGQSRSCSRKRTAQDPATAVIVSLDVDINRALETIVICPSTTQLHPGWRSRIPVKIAGKAAEIAADQIRAISKRRLGRKIGALSTRDAATLRRLLGEMYTDS